MRFGIEIEFTGVSRKEAAKAIADVLNTEYIYEQYQGKAGRSRRYRIVDDLGQSWCLVRDFSIHRNIRGIPTDEAEYGCELVSPVIHSTTMLGKILQSLNKIGATINESCGCHVHIDAPEPKTLYSIMEKFFTIQDRVVKEFDIPEYRVQNYCKLYTDGFISGFKSLENRGMSDIQDYVYNTLAPEEDRGWRKNSARYYAINIDSIYKRNTLEFRLFNSTLDAGVIGNYLYFIRDLAG